MPGQPVEKGSDELPVIVQGPWSKDKQHFVSYFAALFNGGMKNIWSKRVYVDLFAGPGMCVDQTTQTEFEGSPLRALGCPTPFTHFFFNDINNQFVNALKQRQERLFPSANVNYYNSQSNLATSKIANDLPQGALVLVFVDPWSYEITFDALASLAERPSTDLIVTFHSTMIKRNAHLQIAAVDGFLNDPNWRESYWAAEGDPSKPRTVVLIDIFRTQLTNRLGYRYFGDPAIIRNTKGAPFFYLLFASRHSRGLDFWKKSLIARFQRFESIFSGL